MSTRKLYYERRETEHDPPFNIMLEPFRNEYDRRWNGVMIGPLDTPYENGVFHFRIDFPDKYAYVSLKIQLLTKIFHPNVFPNGIICMDTLKDEWAVANSVNSILVSFASLLHDPNPDDPANPEAAHYYRSDREKYHRIARQWTEQYAIDPSIQEKINTAKQVITEELRGIEANYSSNVNIRPFDMRDLFFWQGTIVGPPDSPYREKSFVIHIRYPLNYPEKPPSIVFRSHINHPEISREGFIGKDFKTKWTTNISISKMLKDLFALLSNPNPDDSSNLDDIFL